MRFSLRSLLFLTTAAAVVVGGLFHPTTWIADLVFSACYIAVGVGVLFAIQRRGELRAYWIGFCLTAIGYIWLSGLNDLGKYYYPRMTREDGRADVTEPQLITTTLLDAFYKWRILPNLAARTRPVWSMPAGSIPLWQSSNGQIDPNHVAVMAIGHSAFALALGCIGGWIARRISVAQGTAAVVVEHGAGLTVAPSKHLVILLAGKRNLRWLFFFVIAVVISYHLIRPTLIVSDVYRSVCAAGIVAAVLMAINNRGRRRAYWLGFATAATAYGYFAYASMLTRLNNEMMNLQLVGGKVVSPDLFTSDLLTWYYDHFGDPDRSLMPTYSPIRRDAVRLNPNQISNLRQIDRRYVAFITIGHCLFAWLFGWIGARFSLAVYDRSGLGALPADPAAIPQH